MPLSVCSECGCHLPPKTCWCEECGTKIRCGPSSSASSTSAAALLLGLVACTGPGKPGGGYSSVCVDYGGCYSDSDTDADSDSDTDADADADSDADADPTATTGDTGGATGDTVGATGDTAGTANTGDTASTRGGQ